MVRVLAALLLLPILLIACRPADQAEQVGAAPPAELGDEFRAFYERFLRDSLYQMEHIQFPVPGLPNNATGDDPDFRWTRENWTLHRPNDAEQTGFSSRFTPIGDDLVIEQLVHPGSGMMLERRFARLDDENWYLIYYAGMNPLQ